MKLWMKIVLWVYIAFNLLQAVALTFSPELTDHALIIAVTIIAMGLRHSADRRSRPVRNLRARGLPARTPCPR